jgi:polyhydroxyalkanoate synthesis regulator phasin
MSARPVGSVSGDAARRAAEVSARRQPEQARPAVQTRVQSPVSPRPQLPVAAKDEFVSAAVGSGTRPAETKLPDKAEELPKLFPELKDAPKEKLDKAYKAMEKLVNGNFSEQAAALGKLAKEFPDTTKNVLGKLGLKDSKLAKLATNKDALASLSTLTDEKASGADKAKAALELANTTGEIFKPEELKGVLSTVLNGLPAGARLAEAIGTFTDPKKGAVDKAKASLELADSLREFAGKEFPKLANDLRKLDGTFRAANAAIKLTDPEAPVQDKALAAAQLAAELPDLKKDLTAFKDALKQAGVKNADQVADEGLKLADVAVKGLDPALAKSLNADQLKNLEALATKVGPDNLEGVLKGIKDPKALEGLMGQLDGDAGKRLLKTLGDMEYGNLGKVLSDPKMVEQLGTLATKLDDDAAKLVGKLAKDMDVDGLKMLLKFTDGVSDDVLKTGLKGLGPLLEQGGGKLVGKSLKLLDDVLGKMGVKVTGEVAQKVFKNLAKAIPVAGAVPGLIDAAKFGKEAIDLHGKNKDLGYFALTAAKLNAADAVVGTVLDATGVGAVVDLGVGAAFGVTELAMELGFDAEKAKMEADPQNYKAPDWMKAVNLATAAAQGPQGMTELAAYYGPEGAAELTQWGIEKGTKGAIEAARFVGVEGAEAAGRQLKLTAAFIRQMSDVIRNPSKYGDAVATKAREAYNTVIEKGGAMAEEAKKVIGGVIDEAKKKGLEGLETLKFIAQNPGPVAKMAVDGIQSMIQEGGDWLKQGGAAALKKAVETLQGLKQGWENLQGAAKEKAKELIEGAKAGVQTAFNKAVELGDKGVELLEWAVKNPGELAEMGKKAYLDVLAKGGAAAQKAWASIQNMGKDGLALAEAGIKKLKEAGAQGVETLKYIAENPGQFANEVRGWVAQSLKDMAKATGDAAKAAAGAIKEFADRRVDWAKKLAVELLKDGVSSMKEVAAAWGTQLTDGGREVVAALKDLGKDGVNALQDLANRGGDLANLAVDRLQELSRMGVEGASAALNNLSNLASEVGNRARSAYNNVTGAVSNAASNAYNSLPTRREVWNNITSLLP